MPIDYERLLNRHFPELEQTYTEKDSILYALGVGLGADPTDERQLPFVYEDGQQALPTMGVVLAYPGFWLKQPDTGVDWVKVLHGEQGIALHRPLPPSGTVIGKTRVTAIVDKGEGKGALIYSERNVYDKADGALLCTLTSTSFCRGDGGFGGPAGPVNPPHPIPNRAPDLTCDLPTFPQMALVYRLSGDRNPLHADPKIARAAGFARPILHGLATFGVAGHALLRTVCDYQPERLKGMAVRFSAPVYPGETIRTELWRDGNTVSFRSRVPERDVVVLNNGRADLA